MASNAQKEALKLINEAKSKRSRASSNTPITGDELQNGDNKQVSTNKWIKKPKSADFQAVEKSDFIKEKLLEMGGTVEIEDEDSYLAQQPSILLNNTEDDKKRFFDNLQSIHPGGFHNLEISSEDDEDDPSYMVSTKKSEWLKILENNDKEIKEIENLAASADDITTTEDTSQLLATSRESDSSILKSDRNLESISEIAQSASRISSSSKAASMLQASAAATNLEDGDYSMSFESITDLKNQEFQKNQIFDTETASHFESKKELEATFDDSISSISMDDRPSESFVKQDQQDDVHINATPTCQTPTLPSTVPEKEAAVELSSNLLVEAAVELSSTADRTPPHSENAKNATDVESPPPHRHPIIFHESQQHSIQKIEALKTDSPIVVQAKPDHTYLTFAQLLEMNNQHEEDVKPKISLTTKSKNEAKSVVKRPLKNSNSAPVHPQSSEKIIKKAILQKANAKLKSSAPANSKAKKSADAFVPEKRPSSPIKRLSPHKSPVDATARSKLPTSIIYPLKKESHQVRTETFSVEQDEDLVSKKEDTRYIDILKENEALQQKISDLEVKSQKLVVKVDEHKKEAQDKQEEITSILQQNQFLEILLQEKSSTAVAPSNEPEVQKKLDDQEFLIRGYQTENEKLVLQIKSLKKTTKDLENRQFLKLEAAQRETATIKTQLELAESSLRKASSISNTQATLTIEELKSSMSKMQHEMETQKEDSRQQILKFEALLADANKRADEALSSHPEHIKKLVADLDEQRVVREKYIVELETKLEWHIGNQDIFNQVQHRIDRYEKTIIQLNKALESQIGTSSSSQQRSSNDIKKIKQLENQIADLQEQIMHSDKELPELGMESPRPLIANQQVVVYLKTIIHDMENNHGKFKLENDEKVKLLSQKLEEKDLEISSIANELSSLKLALAASNDPFTNETKRPIPSPSSSERPSNEEPISKTHSLEIKLKRRISELEDELLNVKSERENAELEISKMVKEKNQMLKTMENRQQELKNQYQQKILEVGKTNPSVQAMRAELESSISKNTTLTMKLELAEKAHQALHDSTIDLMKSSQEQASRMAFEHFEHSMEILRTELRKEQSAQSAAMIDSFRRRIFDLEAKLAEAQDPNDTRLDDLRTKLLNLDNAHQSLLTIHSGCEERLKRSREELPPSLLELDRLVTRLYELEANSKVRERILKQALETQSSQAEMQNLSLQKELRLKETQIKRFKVEMESIVQEILELKIKYGS